MSRPNLVTSEQEDQVKGPFIFFLEKQKDKRIRRREKKACAEVEQP